MTYTQDVSAILDYTQDWGPILAANGGATIASCTVTPAVVAPGTGTPSVTKSNTTTTVTYRLTTAGLSTPSMVDVVVHVTLSTGEQDERTDHVQVTNR
jgi:hypothetical protein